MRAEQSVVVPNPLGIHVRPSTALAKLASSFQSRVEIIRDSQGVNAKSSIELLTLAAVMGTRLEVRADGPDAEAAVQAIARLIETGFEEM